MITKLIWRLLVTIFVVLGGLYAYDLYQSSQGTNIQSAARTQVEQNIEIQEDVLSRTDRIRRLFHIKDVIPEALNKRVPKDDQVRGDNMSDFLKKAIVATEDKRFYDHGAIDPKAVVRAGYNNFVAGETVEGGSTITQQLVKNLFLSSKRIFSRKVEEALLATQVENNYSKDEILAMYLNSVYLGNDFVGVKEASEGYFDTKPGRLSLAQAAMLAGIPRAPSYYDPIHNFTAAKHRQKTVLRLMMEQGMITKEQMESAYEEPLRIQGRLRTLDDVDQSSDEGASESSTLDVTDSINRVLDSVKTDDKTDTSKDSKDSATDKTKSGRGGRI